MTARLTSPKYFFWIRQFATHAGRNGIPLVTLHRIGAVGARLVGPDQVQISATLCSSEDKFDSVKARRPLWSINTKEHRIVISKTDALKLNFVELMKLLKFQRPQAISQLGRVPTRHHNRALRRIILDVFDMKMNPQTLDTVFSQFADTQYLMGQLLGLAKNADNHAELTAAHKQLIRGSIVPNVQESMSKLKASLVALKSVATYLKSKQIPVKRAVKSVINVKSKAKKVLSAKAK